MAYPIENFNGGKCPDSHPVPLVSSESVTMQLAYRLHLIISLVFYEILFETNKFSDKWHDPNGVGHPFILSTGDVTGYGYVSISTYVGTESLTSIYSPSTALQYAWRLR